MSTRKMLRVVLARVLWAGQNDTTKWRLVRGCNYIGHQRVMTRCRVSKLTKKITIAQ
jgi:hypothetical protein